MFVCQVEFNSKLFVFQKSSSATRKHENKLQPKFVRKAYTNMPRA